MGSRIPQSGTPTAGTNAADVEIRVASEQVRTLYSQSALVLIANVVNAIIVSIASWDGVPHQALVVWTCAMTVMALVRWRLWRQFQKIPRPADELAKWARVAVGGALVAGVLWGIAGGVFYSGGAIAPQLILAFVLGGMGASAAGTVSVYLPVFFAYFLPSIVPLIVKLCAFADGPYLGMAALVAVFAVLMSGVARNINRAFTASFRLRFENEALVEKLGSAKRGLLEVNAELERRVAERTVQIARQADEQTRLERDLQSARRLEAIGRLAGGVAHDFNNALSVVTAGIESLRDKLSDEERVLVLRDMEDRARGAASIASQLMAFSRGRTDQRGQCQPRKVIERFVGGLRGMLPDNIALDVRCEDTGVIDLPAAHLEQVLLTLALNAREAMPAGGVITLRSRDRGNAIVIDVDDEGEGMDDDTAARIFDPYFTTKGETRSGLGLAAAWGLVTGVGGAIGVESRPGNGARFHLTFLRIADATAESVT